jgi:dTDP-4-amino-4,6-dideoxygalactose transaminase
MRLGGLEAASLSVKLKYLDAWNQRRKEIAKRYQQGITHPKIKLQVQPDFADSVYHLFVITTENRDGLMSYLNENQIFPGLHYPVPCHLQKAYAHLGYKSGDFPNAEYLASHSLSLPMYAELSDEEVGYIIEVINKFS